MDEAIKRVCAKHYHRTLFLSQTANHPRLRVTYSTTGNFEDDSLPAVLFCGPMAGSRWNTILMDNLATTTGVRVICLDRPGKGGSTAVSLDIRMTVWLETIPALLNALDVRHVSLMSHSAGTMYALNTIYHLRYLLDPQRPYLALVAPWVHNDHSDATLMTIASKLPTKVISAWPPLIKFILGRIVPVTSWSGDMLSPVTDLFQVQANGGDTGKLTFGEKYGVDEEVGEYLGRRA